jgi:hypothetical protein
MVSVCPAILTVPVLPVLVPTFGAAVIVSAALPLPDALLTASHGSPGVAFHAHDAAVVSVTLMAPPSAATDALPGLIA